MTGMSGSARRAREIEVAVRPASERYGARRSSLGAGLGLGLVALLGGLDVVGHGAPFVVSFVQNARKR
jgi:hypothetical protein